MISIQKIAPLLAILLTSYISSYSHNAYAAVGYPDLPSPDPFTKPFSIFFISKFLNPSRSLPTTLINYFLPAILGIAGFITIIMIVISGIQFITSFGNPEAAAAGRG